jgi:hypothetical protein
MIRGIIFGAGVAALMIGSVSTAQETGSLITRKPAQIDSRDKDAARKTLEVFATCIVERQSGRAAKLANMRVDTPEYLKQLNGLSDFYDDCISSGRFEYGYSLLRGAIFQALYKREFKLSGPLTFNPALESGYATLYTEPYSPEVQSSIAQVRFGECVSRADAANVRGFISAPPGSALETSSVQALAPKLGPCVAQGNQIKFNKTVLKGMLAEGLYRLSMASKAVEGAK